MHFNKRLSNPVIPTTKKVEIEMLLAIRQDTRRNPNSPHKQVAQIMLLDKATPVK